jgi:hypothetical protein
MRSSGGAACAGAIGVFPAGAGGLVGVGLTATFGAGVAFLRDARDAFIAGLFLTVLVFLRVAGLAAGVFLRFAFVFALVLFFVAICSLRHAC